MEIVDALLSAAYEMARRGRERISIDDSLDYQIIERCERNLGRIRATYC